jgi:hypothetical protein
VDIASPEVACHPQGFSRRTMNRRVSASDARNLAALQGHLATLLHSSRVGGVQLVLVMGGFQKNRDQAIPIIFASAGRSRTRFRVRRVPNFDNLNRFLICAIFPLKMPLFLIAKTFLIVLKSCSS